MLQAGEDLSGTPHRGHLLAELARLHPHCDVDAMFEQVSAVAGAQIIAASTGNNAIFILLSGRACAVFAPAQGKERPILRFLPGAAIGESARDGAGTRPAEIRAKTDCILLRIDPE